MLLNLAPCIPKSSSALSFSLVSIVISSFLQSSIVSKLSLDPLLAVTSETLVGLSLVRLSVKSLHRRISSSESSLSNCFLLEKIDDQGFVAPVDDLSSFSKSMISWKEVQRVSEILF